MPRLRRIWQLIMEMDESDKLNQVIWEHSSPIISLFLKSISSKFNLGIPEGPCDRVIFFNVSDELSKQLVLIGGRYSKEHLNYTEQLQPQNLPVAEEAAINSLSSWRHYLTCQRKKSLPMTKSKLEETDHQSGPHFLLKYFFLLTLDISFHLKRNLRLIDFNSCLTPLVCITSRRKMMYNEGTDWFYVTREFHKPEVIIFFFVHCSLTYR